jgi:hypothetical protein
MREGIKQIYVLALEKLLDFPHYLRTPADPSQPIAAIKLEAAAEAPTKSIHGGWFAQI